MQLLICCCKGSDSEIVAASLFDDFLIDSPKFSLSMALSESSEQGAANDNSSLQWYIPFKIY